MIYLVVNSSEIRTCHHEWFFSQFIRDRQNYLMVKIQNRGNQVQTLYPSFSAMPWLKRVNFLIFLTK